MPTAYRLPQLNAVAVPEGVDEDLPLKRVAGLGYVPDKAVPRLVRAARRSLGRGAGAERPA